MRFHLRVALPAVLQIILIKPLLPAALPVVLQTNNHITAPGKNPPGVHQKIGGLTYYETIFCLSMAHYRRL